MVPSDFEDDLEEFARTRDRLRRLVDSADWPTTVAAAKAGVISAQTLGFRAEKFAADAFGWQRVPTKLRRGDLVTPENEYIELKNSAAIGGQVMVRQIRTSQRVNWLLVLVAAPDGDTEVFVLDRTDVEYETRDMTAAHGVRETASELAMSFPIGGSIHRRWIDRYRVAKVRDLHDAHDEVNRAVRPQNKEHAA